MHVTRARHVEHTPCLQAINARIISGAIKTLRVLYLSREGTVGELPCVGYMRRQYRKPHLGNRKRKMKTSLSHFCPHNFLGVFVITRCRPPPPVHALDYFVARGVGHSRRLPSSIHFPVLRTSYYLHSRSRTLRSPLQTKIRLHYSGKHVQVSLTATYYGEIMLVQWATQA